MNGEYFAAPRRALTTIFVKEELLWTSLQSNKAEIVRYSQVHCFTPQSEPLTQDSPEWRHPRKLILRRHCARATALRAALHLIDLIAAHCPPHHTGAPTALSTPTPHPTQPHPLQAPVNRAMRRRVPRLVMSPTRLCPRKNDLIKKLLHLQDRYQIGVKLLELRSFIQNLKIHKHCPEIDLDLI